MLNPKDQISFGAATSLTINHPETISRPHPNFTSNTPTRVLIASRQGLPPSLLSGARNLPENALYSKLQQVVTSLPPANLPNKPSDLTWSLFWSAPTSYDQPATPVSKVRAAHLVLLKSDLARVTVWTTLLDEEVALLWRRSWPPPNCSGLRIRDRSPLLLILIIYKLVTGTTRRYGHTYGWACLGVSLTAKSRFTSAGSLQSVTLCRGNRFARGATWAHFT